MKEIVGITHLAGYMRVTSARLRDLIKAGRIRPDYRADGKHVYFSVKHATAIIRAHVAQKGKPARTRRTYDK